MDKEPPVFQRLFARFSGFCHDFVPAASAATARAGVALCTAALVSTGVPAQTALAQPATTWRTLDPMNDAAGWHVQPSDGVKASVVTDTVEGGQSVVRLDVDFTSGAGFVVLSRDIEVTLPENYAFAVDLRGELGDNNLELKLVDQPRERPEGAGENVWWVNRKAYRFPRTFTTLTCRARHFSFAWGPGHGAKIPVVKRVEFAIAASEGGKGSVWFRDLRFRELPASSGESTIVSAEASSTLDADHGAGNLVTGAQPGWASAKDVKEATITLPFSTPREVGAVTLNWKSGASPEDYEVQFSDDAQTWVTARRIVGSSGLQDVIPTPDAEGSALRIVMRKPAVGAGFALDSLKLHGPEFSSSPSAILSSFAKMRPRGWYPRMYLGEQSYWTVVGVSGDDNEGLLSEDGQLEVGKRGFTLEPFIYLDGADKPLTWADGETRHGLPLGYIPVPSLTRKMGALDLSVTAWASGKPGESILWVRYRLDNTGNAPIKGKFFLAFRPSQVLTPWQQLNLDGGFSPIHSLRFDGADAIINDSTRVRALVRPQPGDIAAISSDDGDIIEWISRGDLPNSEQATDDTGFASGAAMWKFGVDPRNSVNLYFAIPLHTSFGPLEQPGPIRGGLANFVEGIHRDTLDGWKAALSKTGLDLPSEGGGREVQNAVLANLGYILINRDGPGIQPGSRTYERSWIRDGSMTSAALLKLGMTQEVKQFVEWYAPYQFESGKVPCVVDRRGPDPVPEHDSHGQLIWAIVNTARQTGDDEFLRRMYPHIRRAVAHINELRAQRMTERYRSDDLSTPEPGKPPVPLKAFFGLVPESISHEGYSAKPMHSFWDGLYVLRGLRDAVWAAERLGEKADALAWAKDRDQYSTDLRASFALTMKTHGIDYIPGCVELGDFDPTSTSIALDPVSAEDVLPEGALKRTFEKYVQNMRDRLKNPSTYTPYEWRNVGALVRLGMKAEAWELTRFLLRDSRPAGWHTFAEIVYPGYRDKGFVGDIPHTWCGSDFINAVITMLVYTRDDENAIVLLAGVPEVMARSLNGVGFTDLHTVYGPISARAKSADNTFRVQVTGDHLTMPAGGVVICSPGDTAPTSATLNGQPATLEAGRVRVHTLPAEVVFTH
jgi:hypothetical protein